MVYGRLAEQTNPVKNVIYKLVDTFKLISKYSLVNPLREVTSSQAFVAPIIEDVDQIYVYDFSEAQEVNTAAESKDSGDAKITIWGATYKKPEFIAALKTISKDRIASNISDAKLIEKVNALSDEEEEALKAAVESHKSE